MPDAGSPAPAAPLKKTALNATHRALKAKMVDFGGWDMPVEYPGPGGGLIAEQNMLPLEIRPQTIREEATVYAVFAIE